MPYSECVPDFGVTAETPPDEFYRLGLIYSTGIGVAVDYVAAHKWFNLAERMGSTQARASRRSISEIMPPADIRAAQRSAREWMRRYMTH